MHITTFETFPQDAKLAEGLDVAGACHDESESERQDTETGVHSGFVDLILRLVRRIRQNRTSARLGAGDYLQPLPEELYLVDDQAFGVWASRASVLEADTESRACYDIHEAESDGCEINLVKLDPRAEFLLHLIEIRLENLFDQRWYLGTEPFLRALDAIPQNQVPAQDFLEQDLRHDELHIVECLRHHQSVRDVLVVRFQMGQGECHNSGRACHIDVDHIVFFDR